jgi:hypothetical protein
MRKSGPRRACRRTERHNRNKRRRRKRRDDRTGRGRRRGDADHDGESQATALATDLGLRLFWAINVLLFVVERRLILVAPFAGLPFVR